MHIEVRSSGNMDLFLYNPIRTVIKVEEKEKERGEERYNLCNSHFLIPRRDYSPRLMALVRNPVI